VHLPVARVLDYNDKTKKFLVKHKGAWMCGRCWSIGGGGGDLR
jgi:hypothetical protein